jgi:hypothetical protein
MVITPQEIVCGFGSGIYSVQVMVVIQLCLSYKSCVGANAVQVMVVIQLCLSYRSCVGANAVHEIVMQ